MDRRLIEEWLPIAEIGIESTRERTPMTPFPAPNRLHVWWARRPLVASRAAVLASLLPAGADRKAFLHALGIHGDPVAARRALDRVKLTGIRIPEPYGYSRVFGYTATEADQDALGIPDLGDVYILDPTAGGGAIPFEAVRLGFNASANDINSVAAVVLNATVKLPAESPVEVLKEYRRMAAKMRSELQERLADLYPAGSQTSVDMTYLWARTITCPYCNGLIPLSPNWRLAPDGTGVRLKPLVAKGPGSDGRRCEFEVVPLTKQQSEGTVNRGDATCPFPDCERVVDGDEVKRQAQAGKMGEQLYTVIYKEQRTTTTKSGKPGKPKWVRGYRAPQAADQVLDMVERRLAEKMSDWEMLNVVPSEEILGLPITWTEEAFLRYFEIVASENPSNDDLTYAFRLFRDVEDRFGRLESSKVARVLGGESTTKRHRILKGLRDETGLKVQQFSAHERRLACRLLKSHSPVSTLISRHTRNLLRSYYRQGKINTPIADREVRDDFIQMTDAERTVYENLERYITSTFNAAAPEKRTATGFILTVYRRRVASSFHALSCTLTKRLQRLTGLGIQNRVLEDEDILDEAPDDIPIDDIDEQSELLTAVAEERIDIETLLAETKVLPRDTKGSKLIDHLNSLKQEGYRQTMVFTQYTDTMDILRDTVAELTGRTVLCFSGRGGERRTDDGRWELISREDAKQRFSQGQAEIMLCTDAAAEGLNFQFCGSLINYDMPWNPMRVEQRIGRIDRLGQKHPTIKIVNLHYADTVETDVYTALQERIGLFETFVGRLQPILSRVQHTITDLAMTPAAARSQVRENRIHELLDQADQAEKSGFDIDDLASSQFDPMAIPDPPYTLGDLEVALTREELLEPGAEVRRLTGGKNHAFRLPGMTQELRVTTDADFFDLHSASVELW